MELRVGTVLACSGIEWTYGDGVPVVKWLDECGKWLANDCELRPATANMWSSAPQDGYLELVVQVQQGAVR
jgi:hypothetical protein